MKKKEKKSKLRRDIVDFAQNHNLVVHPGRGYEYYVENYLLFGSCACDRTRLTCPCVECLAEIKKDGWCKCRLYFKNLGTYKAKYLSE